MPSQRIDISLADCDLLISMSQRKPQKSLEVHVSFEASRVSSECLASAYEQIVPLVRRSTLIHPQRLKEQREAEESQVRGMKA
jgi:hypothetical protein